MKKSVIFTFLALASLLTAKPSVDLSGEWRFGLDPQDSGIAAHLENGTLPYAIRLPGSMTSQGFGEAPSMKTEWTGDGWRYPEMFKEWQADDHFKFPFFLHPQ